jgi:hypothetical protein
MIVWNRSGNSLRIPQLEVSALPPSTSKYSGSGQRPGKSLEQAAAPVGGPTSHSKPLQVHSGALAGVPRPVPDPITVAILDTLRAL